MSKNREYLPELLDRVRAILDCGKRGMRSELARFVLPDYALNAACVKVSIWLREENPSPPTGEYILRIQAWAAVKTLEIDAAGEETRERYRVAFAKTKSGRAKK